MDLVSAPVTNCPSCGSTDVGLVYLTPSSERECRGCARKFESAGQAFEPPWTAAPPATDYVWEEVVGAAVSVVPTDVSLVPTRPMSPPPVLEEAAPFEPPAVGALEHPYF